MPKAGTSSEQQLVFKNFADNKNPAEAISCNFFIIVTSGHRFRSNFDRVFVILKQVSSEILGQKEIF